MTAAGRSCMGPGNGVAGIKQEGQYNPESYVSPNLSVSVNLLTKKPRAGRSRTKRFLGFGEQLASNRQKGTEVVQWSASQREGPNGDDKFLTLTGSRGDVGKIFSGHVVKVKGDRNVARALDNEFSNDDGSDYDDFLPPLKKTNRRARIPSSNGMYTTNPNRHCSVCGMTGMCRGNIWCPLFMDTCG